jgi:hypothetical protein
MIDLMRTLMTDDDKARQFQAGGPRLANPPIPQAQLQILQEF